MQQVTVTMLNMRPESTIQNRYSAVSLPMWWLIVNQLPVTYKGKELLLPAQLFQHRYVHRFQVEVQGEQVLFERDDEGAYRALINPEEAHRSKLDRELLQAIVEALEAL